MRIFRVGPIKNEKMYLKVIKKLEDNGYFKNDRASSNKRVTPYIFVGHVAYICNDEPGGKLITPKEFLTDKISIHAQPVTPRKLVNNNDLIDT